MAISKHARKLRDINLSGCAYISDDCIFEFLGLPDLEVLNLSKCRGISTSGVTSLSATLEKKPADVGTIVLAHCTNLTHSTLALILQSCRNIQSLDLFECVMLGDSSLELISGIEFLHTLHIGQMNVTDAAVVKLATKLKHLRYFNAFSCVHLTDKSAIALLTNCLHLQTLHLTACYQITDASLYTLLSLKCCRLQLLAVTDTSVTQPALDKVAHHNPFLQIHHLQRQRQQDHNIEGINENP